MFLHFSCHYQAGNWFPWSMSSILSSYVLKLQVFCFFFLCSLDCIFLVYLWCWLFVVLSRQQPQYSRLVLCICLKNVADLKGYYSKSWRTPRGQISSQWRHHNMWSMSNIYSCTCNSASVMSLIGPAVVKKLPLEHTVINAQEKISDDMYDTPSSMVFLIKN
jgi:hypothetical protein